MVEIIPAILPQDFQEVRDKMSKVTGLVPLVQIDITDGILTPDKTWPFLDGNDNSFVRIVEGEDYFPFWEDLEFELDMMVANPLAYVDDWIAAGARRFIIHFEGLEDVAGTLSAFQEKTVGKESPLYTEIGLAINADTPVENIFPYLPEIDFVQCMGIQKIGYQGQPFYEQVIPTIENLRKHSKELIISVDGGVSLETAPQLIRAGANRLVSGSAIFESDNVSETIKIFQSFGGQETGE